MNAYCKYVSKMQTSPFDYVISCQAISLMPIHFIVPISYTSFLFHGGVLHFFNLVPCQMTTLQNEQKPQMQRWHNCSNPKHFSLNEGFGITHGAHCMWGSLLRLLTCPSIGFLRKYTFWRSRAMATLLWLAPYKRALFGYEVLLPDLSLLLLTFIFIQKSH